MQRRLTIALVATALVSIVLVGFGVLTMAQLGARARAEDQVSRGLNVIADFLDDDGRSLRQAESLLVGSRRNLGLRLIEPVVVAEDGTVSLFTGPRRRGEPVPDVPQLVIDQQQLMALGEGQTVLLARNRTVYGLRAVPLTPPPDRGIEQIAVLAAQPVTAVSRQTVAWFLLSSAIVLAGALLAGIWLAKRLAGPIKDIKDATSAIAAGDLGARVETSGQDEVADLGQAVNRMAADLQRSKALDRQFLMSVSHDLRTPLTAIAGYAEALKDGAITDPRAAGEIIRSHATRLDLLVSDLLDLAKLDANRFRLDLRHFDLAVVTGRTVAGLIPRARHHGVTLDRAGLDSLIVVADPDRTAQAIGNLIDNAVKFAAARVEVDVARHGDRAVVAVRDDGPGIAPEDLPHIFDRLYTGTAQPDRAENPSGLGLAIVRELASAMGGSVGAANNPGGGACLSLFLPLDRSTTPEGPTRPERLARSPRPPDPDRTSRLPAWPAPPPSASDSPTRPHPSPATPPRS